MISIVDLIITAAVVSICAATTAGTLVYCILKKKHDEDVARLSKELADTKAELKDLSQFRCLYNRYKKYKAYESNDELGYFIKALEECDEERL